MELGVRVGVRVRVRGRGRVTSHVAEALEL